MLGQYYLPDALIQHQLWLRVGNTLFLFPLSSRSVCIEPVSTLGTLSIVQGVQGP